MFADFSSTFLQQVRHLGPFFRDISNIFVKTYRPVLFKYIFLLANMQIFVIWTRSCQYKFIKMCCVAEKNDPCSFLSIFLQQHF